MFSQIVNPKTGRKVSINSRLGKRILSNYVNQLGGHNGPCAVNPSSADVKRVKSVIVIVKSLTGDVKKDQNC